MIQNVLNGLGLVGEQLDEMKIAVLRVNYIVEIL